MENNNKTLLKGLLAVLALALSNEQMLNSSEYNRMILVGILTIFTLVFSSEQLVNTVKDVINRRDLVDESLLANPLLGGDFVKMIQDIYHHHRVKSPMPKLSRREKEVLCNMANGLMNKEIAKKMGVSEGTIKIYVSSILSKMNANVRTEAVVTAIKLGFVSVNDTVF